MHDYYDDARITAYNYFWLPNPGRYYAKVRVYFEGEWSEPLVTPSWDAVSRLGLSASMSWGACSCDTTAGLIAFLQRLVAHPVNTATGNFTETVADMSMPAPGVNLDVSRTYNSADTSVGLLGKGWTFPYEASLKIEADKLTYRAEDGQRVEFTKKPDGPYAAPAGSRSRIAAVTGGFALTTRDYQRLEFDAKGHLTSWKDAAGQGLTFTYGVGLSKITDAAGREVTVELEGEKVKKLTLPDGRYVQYGYDGDLLTTVRDLNGGTTTYRHDAAGRINKVTDQRNRLVTQNTYDTEGRVQEQLDQTEGKWVFTYDQDPEHPVRTSTTVTNPRGFNHTYSYSANVLMAEVDALSRVTTYTYDPRLNRTSKTTPRGHTWKWEYDDLDRVTKEITPKDWPWFKTWTYHGSSDEVATYTNWKGVKTEYLDYTAAHRPQTITETSKDGSLSRTRKVEYNARGQVAAEVSFAARRTTYGYDAQGNLETETTGEGNTTTYGYDSTSRLKSETDPRGARTTYGYDDADHITSVTDPRGHQTVSKFDLVGDRYEETDPRGKTTTFTYDAAHRITSQTKPRQQAETWRYYPDGKLYAHTDPEGAVTKYGYDQAGQQTSMRTPRGNVEDAAPADYTWVYTYDANGNRETVKDPKGRVWTTKHNDLDWPTDYIDPLGNKTHHSMGSGSEIVKITDPLGHVTQHNYDGLARYHDTITPRGKKTTFGNDLDGLRTSITTPLGHKQTFGYDKEGRQTTEVDPRGNASGADPAKYTWLYGYDKSGNRTGLEDPLGNETKSVFDPAGNLESETDVNGHTTAWAWDNKNRLQSVTGPDGAETSYGYNDVDDLTSRTDPRNNTTTYGYDAMGRVIETVDPLGRTITHTYDPDGNRIETTTARGNAPGGDKAKWTIGYEWDARNLRTAIRSPDAGVAATFDYYDHGKPKTSASLAGSIGYEWDNAGRLAKYNGWSYAYDDDSNVTKRTSPGGSLLNATWDSDGRQTTSDRGGANIAKFYYDAAGNRTRTLFPNATKRLQDRGFDHAGRLQTVANKQETAITSAFTVTRDNAGNPRVVKQQRGTDASYRHYGYDPADRLTSYCQTPTADSCDGATASIGYTYDDSGNLTTETRAGNITRPGATTYTLDAADQITKTTKDGTDTLFEYDADGNIAKAGTATYTHDVLNRQRSLTNTSGTFGYTYNADGHRTGLSTQGQTLREYQWDPNYPDGLPRMTVTAQGTNRQGYRYLDDGTPLELWQATASSPALDAAETDATDAAFLHTDHQGNITDSTDTADGHPETIADFEPYGWRTRTRLDTTAPLPGLGYTGEYHDPNTGGHIHLRARQHDPVLGRFTTTDPARPDPDKPYVTPYAYANNAPMVYADPSGRVPCWLWPSSPDCMDKAVKRIARSEPHTLNYAGGAVTNAVESTRLALALQAYQPGFAVGDLMGANDNARWARGMGADTSSLSYTLGHYFGIPLPLFGGGSIAAGVGRSALRGLLARFAQRCAPRAARTFTSADPHVADIANLIEGAMPGRITGVNSQARVLTGGSREVDIDLGNLIIQVKSGNARKLTRQIQKTVATTGRTTIGYAPNIPEGARRNAARMGIIIVRTPAELLARIRELS